MSQEARDVERQTSSECRCIQVASCAVLALLCACSSAPKPAPLPAIVQIPAPQKKPAIAEVDIVVDPNINPDLSGRPSPVIVRTYELKSVSAFEAASSSALLHGDKDKDSLGADVVERKELTIFPGTNSWLKIPLTPQTRFLGVTAAFRDVDRAKWRASMAISSDDSSQLEIRLELNDLSIKHR
jgi:type VI secretion system protein VasD